MYVIDPKTGYTTPIGTPFTPALSGTSFGVDFNPVVPRLRIVSNANQNLRANPNTGQVQNIDGPLAYAAPARNVGRNPQVVGAAGSNPATDIDAALDILITQNPPNNGTLNTIHGLGVNTTMLVGFDIGGGSYDGYSGSSSVVVIKR